jgi:hypothetical protein
MLQGSVFLCGKGVRKFAIGRFYVKLHSRGNLGVSLGVKARGTTSKELVYGYRTTLPRSVGRMSSLSEISPE